MNNIHKSVFQQLMEVVKNDPNSIKKDLSEIRYIRLDNLGKKCLATATISRQSYTVSPRVKATTISFQQNDYFIMVGLENLQNNDFDLPIVDNEDENGLYAALLELAISELKIPLINNLQALEIIEYIIPNYKGIEDYNGHKISDVKQFFIPIQIYEIETSYILNAEQLKQLVGLRLCKQSNNLVLPFSQNTLDLLKNIFRAGSSAIPYDNLVQCCYSASWKHAFLELYRCIERLYLIPILDRCNTKLGLEKTFIELVKNIDDIFKYNWRPPEKNSVEYIFSNEITPQDAKILLKEVKNLQNKKVGNEQNQDKNLSDWFYGIRNNIVHFGLSSNQQFNIDDEKDWDKIIRAILMIIEAWYKEYENKLAV